VKYEKPALSFDQQVDQLLRRGMTGDRELIKGRLASVNYYRLSGYWYPFRNPNDVFKPGTSFKIVWQRYAFDRRLRLIVMDAIERIEIAVRSQLAYHHAHGHGPFAYSNDARSLPKLSPDKHQEFVLRVQEETSRSKEKFVDHFRTKYGDIHPHLPVWMVTEVMSFGTVLTFYRGASHQVKQAVATEFGMPSVVFDSWLLTLNTVRNICAHHGRLWNRENGIKPIIPRLADYPDWHTPVKIENNRVFAVLTICRHCLNHIAPQSMWSKRLKDLLVEYPTIPLASMGFPANWRASAIWEKAWRG
jgi:abortive infection bacteriophage resistance protein